WEIRADVAPRTSRVTGHRSARAAGACAPPAIDVTGLRRRRVSGAGGRSCASGTPVSAALRGLRTRTMKPTRRRFIAGGVAGAAAAMQGNALAASAPSKSPAGGHALVLTGGVNRGAYQAGAIAGLVEKAGLADGQPLDYDMVAGSSIGSLNAYFVA